MLKELNKEKFGDSISKILLMEKNIFVGILDDQSLLVKEDFKTTYNLLTQMGVLDMCYCLDNVVISSLDNTIKSFDKYSLEYKNVIESEAMENFKIHTYNQEDSTTLVFLGINGKVINYDYLNGEIQSTKNINNNFLTSIDCLDNLNLIVGDNEGNLNIVKKDLSENKIIGNNYQKQIRCIKTIEYGDKAIISCDNTFSYLIDCVKGEEIMYFNGHKDIITEIKVENNENCFFTSSCDGNIIFWDKRDKNRHQISYNNNIPIWSIDLDNNSKTLILGDEDGYLKRLTY